MNINNELIKAIGELAYVVAKAHDNIVLKEKEMFYQILHENFGEFGDVAKDRFDLLCEVTNPIIIHAYNNAIHDLKKNKRQIDKQFIQLATETLNSVAMVHQGKNDFQLFILDRLKHDFQSLTHDV